MQRAQTESQHTEQLGTAAVHVCPRAHACACVFSLRPNVSEAACARMFSCASRAVTGELRLELSAQTHTLDALRREKARLQEQLECEPTPACFRCFSILILRGSLRPCVTEISGRRVAQTAEAATQQACGDQAALLRRVSAVGV